MYCTNCGAKINEGSNFCTSCGTEVTQQPLRQGWSGKKATFWIIVSVILTSVFWGTVYSSGDDQAVNIMSHLFETIGRQSLAWKKTETIITASATGLSDECVYTPGCVDDAISYITTLRAEVEKEREEIDRLWSESVVGADFEDYYSGLSERNQNALIDVINLYFPEEAPELQGVSNKLL